MATPREEGKKMSLSYLMDGSLVVLREGNDSFLEMFHRRLREYPVGSIT